MFHAEGTDSTRTSSKREGFEFKDLEGIVRLELHRGGRACKGSMAGGSSGKAFSLYPDAVGSPDEFKAEAVQISPELHLQKGHCAVQRGACQVWKRQEGDRLGGTLSP